MKAPQAQQAKDQRDRDQNGQNFHECLYFSRSAFNVTVMDDTDMIAAAISGVARPKSAIGTNIAL